MSIFYIFLIFFLLLIIVQLTAKARIFFDVKNNIGYIELRLAGIKILDYEISIISQCLKLSKKNGKNKYLPLELNDEKIEEYTNFQNILFRKTYFKRLGILFDFGVDSNAFLTAQVTEYVDIISKICYTIFKTKKSETMLTLKVNPIFNDNVIKFGFKAKISLSIYDLFWCIAEAKTKKFLTRSKN